jgi:hypothetical protein
LVWVDGEVVQLLGGALAKTELIVAAVFFISILVLDDVTLGRAVITVGEPGAWNRRFLMARSAGGPTIRQEVVQV